MSTAPTFTYQWRRDGVAIVGATAASYRLTAADQGREVSAAVTRTVGSASHSAISPATAPIEAGGDGLSATGGGTKAIACGFGLAIAIAGYSSSELALLFGRMASAGVKWLRWDYQWNGDPDGTVRGGTTDAVYLAARTAGLNNLAILTDNTSTRGDLSSTNGFCTKGGWMSSAVAHLNTLGVHAFEVQNEMNLGINWSSGTASAAKYVAALQTAYATIHAADPDALVLHAGLAPYGAPTGGRQGTNYNPGDFFTEMYAAGAAGSFDASNWHTYCFPDTPATDNPYNTFCHLPTWAYATMEANGDGAKKVWCTEFGINTSDYPTTMAATTMVEGYAMAQGWEWAGPFFWFSWQDTPADGNWGLVTASGQPKTAGGRPLLTTYAGIANLS